MIYLAPIQGFTDFVYRKAFYQVFTGIDSFFIPYISLKNEAIIRKYIQEIWPENNPLKIVVPQVLVKDSAELIQLAHILKEYNYQAVNLNLGCPYPMVTKRGKGAGLLPFPEKIEHLLAEFFDNSDLQLSVKFRAGLFDKSEIEKIIPVFNSFPLNELIFHPRIASQLYKGEILNDSFKKAQDQLKAELVYNGDIFTVDDFNKKRELFPAINNWMLGRGVLMNPFLPAEINGEFILHSEKAEKLSLFHQLVFEGYAEKLDNTGNVLVKMKQFWAYFSFVFSQQKKVFKQIKKIRKFENYIDTVRQIFVQFEIK